MRQSEPKATFLASVIVIVVAAICLVIAGCMTAQEEADCKTNGGDWTWHPSYKYGHYTCENERPTLGAR
jgi:hypothetical protein